MSSTAPRIELSGITQSFGSMKALDDVSLAIAAGEIRGLCGHNGAGKSTLIKIIAGLLTPDAGEIRLDGKLTQLNSPRDAQRAGIAWVDQELSMVPSLTIGENLALGNVAGSVLRHRRAERELACELLAKVGLERHDPADLLSGLSLGERQLVEIARSLGRGAQLLVLDEPTATLTDVEIELVFNAVRRVAQDGCSIIFVSHRLGEVMQLCDHVTVLRDGRLVEERAVSELTADALVEAMLGEQLEFARHETDGRLGEVVLKVEQLTVGSRVRGFSHEFRAGSVYALAGQIGAGASEVLRALAGLTPHASGHVEIAGRRSSLRSPVRVRRSGIGFVTNDRKHEGLFLERPVTENLTVNQLGRISRAGLLSLRQERLHAGELAQAAGVAVDRLDGAVGTLSGGNQQKALVGRYLFGSDTKVLLVDEPTRGVDVGGRAAIHKLLMQAADAGMVVILASSDLEELVEVAATVITMRAGLVVGVYPNGASKQTLLADVTHKPQSGGAEQTEVLR